MFGHNKEKGHSEAPVIQFESLSHEQQRTVLEELAKYGLRPVTAEEAEVLERMKRTGYLEHRDGKWQLIKPLEEVEKNK